jgi:hypothetical protein
VEGGDAREGHLACPTAVAFCTLCSGRCASHTLSGSPAERHPAEHAAVSTALRRTCVSVSWTHRVAIAPVSNRVAVQQSIHLCMALGRSLSAGFRCLRQLRKAGEGLTVRPGCCCVFVLRSTGAMRMRTPDWGGSWVPVLDAASAKESCGSDSLWPVCLDSCSLTAVVTTKQAPYPQVRVAQLRVRLRVLVLGDTADDSWCVSGELLILSGCGVSQHGQPSATSRFHNKFV